MPQTNNPRVDSFIKRDPLYDFVRTEAHHKLCIPGCNFHAIKINDKKFLIQEIQPMWDDLSPAKWLAEISEDGKGIKFVLVD